MANRTFQPIAALDREVKILFGIVTFGGSGAVAGVDALGFTVTKVPATTGQYLITLEDKYNAMLGAALAAYNAGSAGDASYELRTELTNNQTIGLHRLTAGVLADAPSGHKLYVTLFLRNSGLPRAGA